MTDALQALEEIEQGLDELMASLLGLAPQTEPVTAEDSSGQLVATVAPGGHLSRLVLSPRWEQELSAEELADTVLMTIGEATAKSLGLNSSQDEMPTASQAEVDAHMAPYLEAARRQVLQGEQDHEKLADQLEQATKQLDVTLEDVEQRMAKIEDDLPIAGEDAAAGMERPQDAVEVASQNRQVRLWVSKGMVVDAEIPLNWAKGKSGIAITECFDQIIEQLPNIVAEQINTEGDQQ